MSARELKIFVSHSNADNEFTRRLVADLRHRGATVWVDFDEIDSGDFAATINEGMDNCDWLVAVLTPGSLKSKWVIMEVNAAMNMKADGFLNGVIPIVAAPFELTDLPPIWRTLQRYDATQDYDRAFNGLCKGLGLPPLNQKEPALLTVNVSPSGAQVLVDGVGVHGPLTVQMGSATKKTVVVEVSKYGYKPKRLNVEVSTGENQVTEVELEEMTSVEKTLIEKERPSFDKRWFIGVGVIAIAMFAFALRPHSTVNSPGDNVANNVAKAPENSKNLKPSNERWAAGWTADPPLTAPAGSVMAIAFSSNGASFATAGEDKTIRLWDIQTRKLIREIRTSHTESITTIAFSGDNITLAAGSRDKTISLWDIQTGKSLSSPLTGHASHVNSVVFSADGNVLISGSSDHTIRLWDVQTKKLISEPLTGHKNHVVAVAFSPDGNTFASASDDTTVRLWDIKEKKPVGEPLTGHTQEVLSLAFSPDGTLLATGSQDRSIRFWDPRTKKPMGDTLTGHPGGINSLAFSHDGTMLVSGSVDTTVRLWNVQTRKLIGSAINNDAGEVVAVAISPDGNTIAAANGRDTVQLWHPNS